MVRIYQGTPHQSLDRIVKNYNLTNFFRSKFRGEERKNNNIYGGIDPLRSIKKDTVKYLPKNPTFHPARGKRDLLGYGERVKRNRETFTSLEIRTMGQAHVRATIDTVDLVFFHGDTVEAASSLSDLTREKFTSPRNSLHSAFSFRFSSRTRARAHTTPSHVYSSVHKASSRAPHLPRPPHSFTTSSSVEGGLGQPIAAMNK